VVVEVGANEEPLAARRACRTSLDGATRVDEACIDARTGASIRGSSMAGCDVDTPCCCCSRDFSKFGHRGLLRFKH
jgi:hypothetical protein